VVADAKDTSAVVALAQPLMRLGVLQFFRYVAHWNGGRTTRAFKYFPRTATVTAVPGSRLR